jgi:hypothetical protein
MSQRERVSIISLGVIIGVVLGVIFKDMCYRYRCSVSNHGIFK